MTSTHWTFDGGRVRIDVAGRQLWSTASPPGSAAAPSTC